VGGTTVLVKAGTYNEEVAVRSGALNNPVVFEAAPGETVTVTSSDYGFYASGRSWVTIRGFNVLNTADDGFHISSGSSNIKMIGNRVTSAGTPDGTNEAEGISVTDSSNVVVQGNVVDRGSSYGIYLANTTAVQVDRNVSTFNAEVVARRASGIRVHSSTGATISSNVTHHNEDSGIEFVSGAHDNLVVNNVTYDNGDHGIDNLEAPGQRIISNTVLENVTAGINAEGGSTRTLLANNISVDNAINGPRTRGNIRVDASSITGTSIDRDLVHLRTPGTMIVWGDGLYSSLATFRTMVGQEPNGIEADPRWRDVAARDLRLTAVSPAVDSANSGASGQLSTDVEGNPRMDVPGVPNTGAGPRAFDDRGAYEFQAVPMPPNAALTVSPASGKPPLMVTANASESTDPDGDIASYSFSWGDGSSAVGPQAGSSATHSYTQAGTYTVTVTVRDSGGRSSQATAQVLVTNDALPTAALEVTPASGRAPLDIVADASGSVDPDGDIASYRFDFGDGSPAVGPQSEASASHTYASPGTYTVTVTVRDDAGQPASTTRSVEATANLIGNMGFETSLAGWNTSGSGTGITLARVAGGHSGGWAAKLTNTSAAASSCLLNDAPNWVATTVADTYYSSVWARADTAGARLRLRLREYAGSTLVGSVVNELTLGPSWQRVGLQYVPASPGSSTLDLSVYVAGASPGTCFYADDLDLGRGEPAPPPPPPGGPPSASLAVSPASGTAPLDVVADASGSSDPDGDIAGYSFDFGDGSPAVGPQSAAAAGHTYTSPGTYVTTVTVTDAHGRTSQATDEVTVTGNVVGNPGFETSLTGWNTSGSGTGITLSRVAGGHTGGWAAKLTNTSAAASSCLLNDAPNWVATTVAGSYTASVWVRADSPGATFRLRLREYAGTTLAGTATVTATLGTSWQPVSITYLPSAPGASTLDLSAYVTGAAPGTCFYADDVVVEGS
jgi:parallel beta-helix repeat protein